MKEFLDVDSVRKAADFISMGWQDGDTDIVVSYAISKNVIWDSNRHFNDGKKFSSFVGDDVVHNLDKILLENVSGNVFFTPVEHPDLSVARRVYVFSHLSRGLCRRFGISNDVVSTRDIDCNPCIYELTYKDKVYHGLYGKEAFSGFGMLAATLYLVADIMETWKHENE